jgi:multicomponent Na+:H+ antiporter subunit D
VLGAAAILWGGIQASRQAQLKLLVGYSTVSQIGYLFLMFPLVFPPDAQGPWREAAVAGGVFHALTHALAKAAMFLAAGVMLQACRTDLVRGIAGAARAYRSRSSRSALRACRSSVCLRAAASSASGCSSARPSTPGSGGGRSLSSWAGS